MILYCAAAIRSLPLESKEVEVEPVAWRWDQATYMEDDVRGRGWNHNTFGTQKPFSLYMARNITPLYEHPAECPKCAELEKVLEQNHIKHDSTTRALEAAEAETLRVKELHKGLMREADDRYAALLEKYNYERLK